MDKCMKSEPSAIFSSNIGHHKYSAWVPRDLFHAYRGNNTAQKMKFSIKDFLSKCDQIRKFPEKLNEKLHSFAVQLRILSNTKKGGFLENSVST